MKDDAERTVMRKLPKQDRDSLNSFCQWYKTNCPGEHEGSLVFSHDASRLRIRAYGNGRNLAVIFDKIKDAYGLDLKIDPIVPNDIFITVRGDMEGLQHAFDNEKISYGKLFKPFEIDRAYYGWPESVTPAQTEYLAHLAQNLTFERAPYFRDGPDRPPIYMASANVDEPSLYKGILEHTVAPSAGVTIPRNIIEANELGFKMPASLAVELLTEAGVEEYLSPQFTSAYKKHLERLGNDRREKENAPKSAAHRTGRKGHSRIAAPPDSDPGKHSR